MVREIEVSRPVVREIEVSHTAVAKTSFDKILDLTAVVDVFVIL